MNQQELKKRVHYDPVTGLFTWLVHPRKSNIGETAGGLNASGYAVLCMDNQWVYAHRAAFLYMTGRNPKMTDHINGDRSDNRWGNLREVMSSENQVNQKRRSDNSSGVKGVGWNRQRNKWRARLKFQGVETHVGFFDTVEEAREHIQQARKKFHGEFANHG